MTFQVNLGVFLQTKHLNSVYIVSSGSKGSTEVA